jgi:WD40 repeat protein
VGTRRTDARPIIDWRSIFGNDVFISYRRSEAAAYAAWLYQRLNDADLACFLDDHEAVAGTPLTPAIERALDHARALIVIMTDQVHDSAWVQREVDHYAKTGRPIVPIKLGPAMDVAAVKATPLRVIFERDVLWIDEVAGLTGADAPSDATIGRVRSLFHFRRSRLLLRMSSAGIMLLLAAIAIWAMVERTSAIENEKVAISQELAVRSELSMPLDPHRSLDFALRAIQSHPTPPAVTALRRALRDDHLTAVIGGSDDPVRLATFSDDGSRLATLHHPWRVEIRPTADLAKVVRIEKVSSPDTAVIGLAFALGDTVLLTWDLKGRVDVWDVASGRPLRSFSGGSPLMSSAWLSPSGTTIAIPTDLAATRLGLWGVASGTTVQEIDLGPDNITAVAYSANSQQLLIATINPEASASSSYAGARTTLHLINRNGGNMVTSWPAGQQRIGTLAISNSGELIVSAIGGIGPPPPTGRGIDGSQLTLPGHNDDAVKIWRRVDNTYRQVFTAQTYQDPRIKITPDERLVVFANVSEAQVVSTRPVGLYRTLSGHRDYITALAFAPHGDIAATASGDGSARLWSLRTGRALCEFRGHVGGLRSVAVSADGRWAVTVGLDGSARLWDMRCGDANGVELLPPRLNRPIPWPQTTVAAGWIARTMEPNVVAWQSFDGRQSGHVDVAMGSQAIVAMAAAARRLAVVSNKGLVSIVDTDRGTSGAIGPADLDFVFAALNSDGTLLVRGNKTGVVEVFDTESRLSLLHIQRAPSLARTTSLAGPPTSPGEVSPRPEGSIFVAATFDSTRTRLALSSRTDVELRTLPDGKLIARLAEHTEPIQQMHFSSGGDRLLTLAYGRVRGSGEAPILWSALDGRMIRRLEGSQGFVVLSAFTPDGRQVLTVTSEGHLRLWNAKDGSLRTEGKLPPDSHFVRAISLAEDGEFAAIGSEDGRLYIVAVGSLEVLLEVTLGTQGVRDLLFAPRSQYLVALLGDGSVVQYACVMCAPLSELMTRAATRLEIYRSELPLRR